MIDILEKNKDISEFSNFKTPAKARYYCELNTLSDVYLLKEIIDFANTKKLDFLFI